MKLSTSARLVTVVLALVILYGGCDMKTCADEPKRGERMEGQWGVESEGFMMSARSEKEEVGACEPVVVAVRIKNVSDRILSFPESSPESDYGIEVKDDRGEQMPLTRYGKNVLRSGEEHRRVVTKLDPGAEHQQKLLVNRIYDMSTSGTYFVQISRDVFKRDGKGVAKVKSNVLKIKVKD